MDKNEFLYGAVLKITRQDTPDDIRRNFKQMKENGLNTVVIWPATFWWEEKKEGYPFNTGRTILSLAQECDIKVIMELAGQLTVCEYIPDFQMKDEYYPMDVNGQRIYGMQSFGYLNYFHPEVDSLIRRHFAKVAEAYKDYDALYAYDIFNETLAGSYDEYTMEQFRIWLQNKYQTIDKLNAVWERTYTDFSQVSYSPWKWMSIMPEADFTLFQRTITPTILKRWGDTIKSIDPLHPLIADNVGSMVASPSTFCRDDFALKNAVNDIGISFYPKQVTGCSESLKRWQTFDAYYSASKREGFYVAEMQTHIQALFNPTTCVRPYELKLWCNEALSAGCKSLIYWMWRPFDKGLQTMGRGLVDYKNRNTPRLAFAKEFAELLDQTGQLTPIRSQAAIVFDDLCDVYQQGYTKAYNVDQNIYRHSIFGAYKAMLDAGCRCDIIKLDEIRNYKLIILTNHIVLDKAAAALLSTYVQEGGVVICDGKIGMVDETSLLNDELPGGAFNSYIGQEYLDTDYENVNFLYDGLYYDGFYGRDLTIITDGQCLGHFEDGYPAVVAKQFGQGTVITINTFLWYGYLMNGGNANDFAQMLLNTYDLHSLEITPSLRARVCENNDDLFMFIFNYTNESINGHIKGYGFDENVTVASNDVVILRKSKTVL